MNIGLVQSAMQCVS